MEEEEHESEGRLARLDCQTSCQTRTHANLLGQLFADVLGSSEVFSEAVTDEK